MLEREIFDALPVWPAAIWPALSLSLLFAIFALNKKFNDEGTSFPQKYPTFLLPFLLLWAVFLNAFESASMVYFMYMFGLQYIVVLLLVPIFGFLWRLAMALVPAPQYWVPPMHPALAVMSLTMIGALDVEIVRNLNGIIWSWAAALELPGLR